MQGPDLGCQDETLSCRIFLFLCSSVREHCIVPHFSFGFVITDYIMSSGSLLEKLVCTVKDTAALEHTEMETVSI